MPGRPPSPKGDVGPPGGELVLGPLAGPAGLPPDASSAWAVLVTPVAFDPEAGAEPPIREPRGSWTFLLPSARSNPAVASSSGSSAPLATATSALASRTRETAVLRSLLLLSARATRESSVGSRNTVHQRACVFAQFTRQLRHQVAA